MNGEMPLITSRSHSHFPDVAAFTSPWLCHNHMGTSRELTRVMQVRDMQLFHFHLPPCYRAKPVHTYSYGNPSLICVVFVSNKTSSQWCRMLTSHGECVPAEISPSKPSWSTAVSLTKCSLERVVKIMSSAVQGSQQPVE